MSKEVVKGTDDQIEVKASGNPEDENQTYTLSLSKKITDEIDNKINLDGSNFKGSKETLGKNIGLDSITGNTTSLVQEKAVKDYVESKIKDTTDNLSTNAKLSYKDNNKDAKTVSLKEGLNFTNGTNTEVVTENNGVIKFHINEELIGMRGINFTGGTTINNTTINFIDNKGTITGLKDLEKNSDGHTATNKNYVDKEINDIDKNLSDKITQNKNKIAENSDKITQNKNKIAENSDKIIQNKNKIAENSDKITQNKNKIAENFDKITQNKNKIAENFDKITQNKNKINKNENNIININKKIDNFKGEFNKEFAKVDASNLSENHRKEWINKLGTGEIKSDSNGLIKGSTLYKEIRIKKDGAYIKKDNSVADNLQTLDSQVKNNSDRMDGITESIGNMSKNIERTNKVMKSGLAKSAALAGLKPMQYDPLQKNQIMAAIGSFKGEQAVAVGMNHYFNENLMMHGGLAVNQNERNRLETLANVGITWKIGKKDDRKELPQRYNAGPIGSIYKIQQEMENLMQDKNNLEGMLKLTESEVDIIREEKNIQDIEMKQQSKEIKKLKDEINVYKEESKKIKKLEEEINLYKQEIQIQESKSQEQDEKIKEQDNKIKEIEKALEKLSRKKKWFSF